MQENKNSCFPLTPTISAECFFQWMSLVFLNIVGKTCCWEYAFFSETNRGCGYQLAISRQISRQLDVHWEIDIWDHQGWSWCTHQYMRVNGKTMHGKEWWGTKYMYNLCIHIYIYAHMADVLSDYIWTYSFSLWYLWVCMWNLLYGYENHMFLFVAYTICTYNKHSHHVIGCTYLLHMTWAYIYVWCKCIHYVVHMHTWMYIHMTTWYIIWCIDTCYHALIQHDMSWWTVCLSVCLSDCPWHHEHDHNDMTCIITYIWHSWKWHIELS